MEPRKFSAVTVDHSTKITVDQIAALTERSRSRVIRDAIKAYRETAAIRRAFGEKVKPNLEVRA